MVEPAAAAVAVEAYKDVRSIFGSITKKIHYAYESKANFEQMTEQAGMLCARRDDVEAELKQNKMKMATKECEGWIRRVKAAEQEVLKLESKYKKEIRHAWRFPPFYPRANVSKHMAKKCQDLKVLLEQGKFENGVVAERPPEPVIFINAPSIDIHLRWAVEEILGNLRERNVKRIGLWGMVGTGKTRVMQNLNNNEEVKKMFDIVIWVSVSKPWSIEKLQDAIMQRLKLKVEGGISAIEIAQLISNELGGMRYLLLLDEVWDSFDLHQIGIPNNDKDSKVVFASRFRDLCHYMDVDEFVNMKRLSDSDAYKMFEEKVGRSMRDPSIIPIAQLVIKECAGLPLLIDKVAKVFRKRENNIRLWREGLRSLQRWSSIKAQGMDEVLESLKFCYEDLNGEDKKVCFLYGALFPEDRDIFMDYLVECWKAEGFLQSIDEFRDARDRGHKILDDLINVSLLERSPAKTHVRMNKVLRNMALKISSGGPDHKLLARTREGLKECPKEEEWASANRISLMDNDLSNLPAIPNCTNLCTLLLQRNSHLMVIPDSFFSSMQRLRLLDLHGTAIASLPPSMSCLTDLRALYLNSCARLTELPSCLEALVHLEVLDIRRTGILHLPIEVGCLTQMRCLRMSWSNFGTGMPTFFSSVSLLEELVIEVDPNTSWPDQVVKTVTKQVSTLTRLNSLTFSFPNVECLEIFVRSSPMWKHSRFTFQFSVGISNSVKYHLLDYSEYQSCDCLKYAKGECAHPVISEVLAETDIFELIDHKNLSSLSDFGTENMSKLRACSVEGCEDIVCIIDGVAATPPAFEWLQRMVIKNAPSLHCIWQGPVPVGSLGQMTSLSFYGCPKLKKIFSNGLIEQLSELKHLTVEECSEIEEIIIETENPCLDPRTLPSLKILVLHDLPKLRSITPDDTLIWPSLESVDIASCPSLLKLPFSGENAINLRSIDAEQSWWSTLVWQDDAIERRLRPLCNFT